MSDTEMIPAPQNQPPVGAPPDEGGQIIDSTAETSSVKHSSQSPIRVWLIGYVGIAVFCQAIAAVNSATVQFWMTIAMFLAAVAVMVRFRPRRSPHPAALAGLVALALLLLSLMNPSGNSLFARIWQICLYASALLPLFWTNRLEISPRLFREIVIAIWAVTVFGSGLGIAQALSPDRLNTSLAPWLRARGPEYVDTLRSYRSDGHSVFRPMGLSGYPGGAAALGLTAILLGIGLLLDEPKPARKYFWAAGIVLGLICLLCCRSRGADILTVCSVLVILGTLGIRSELQGRVKLVSILTALMLLFLVRAFNEPGTLTDRAGAHQLSTDRFASLLFQYPLGAGLGRWGMAALATENPAQLHGSRLEIDSQWSAWLADGGLPLLLAYAVGTAVAIRWAVRIAIDDARPQTQIWGTIVLAFDIAATVASFGQPLYVELGGLAFWLINSTLFSAYLLGDFVPERARNQQNPRKRVNRYRHAIGVGRENISADDDDLPVMTLSTMGKDPQIAPSGVFQPRRRPGNSAAATATASAIVVARRDGVTEPVTPPAHPTFEAAARRLLEQFRSNNLEPPVSGPFSEDSIVQQPVDPSILRRPIMEEHGLVGEFDVESTAFDHPDDLDD